MATHSSVLAWRIPGMGKPGGLPSVGSHRVGHDWRDLAAAVAVAPGYNPNKEENHMDTYCSVINNHEKWEITSLSNNRKINYLGAYLMSGILYIYSIHRNFSQWILFLLPLLLFFFSVGRPCLFLVAACVIFLLRYVGLWRRKWQPIPMFFPGKSHGQRTLVGYSPWSQRVRHDWATSLHFTND